MPIIEVVLVIRLSVLGLRGALRGEGCDLCNALQLSLSSFCPTLKPVQCLTGRIFVITEGGDGGQSPDDWQGPLSRITTNHCVYTSA